MIDYNKKLVSGETPKKKGFAPLPSGEYVVEIESISAPNEVNIDNAKIKLRDENNKIVRGEYTTAPKLQFVRFDVTLKITEGEFAGRKIWTKLSTHPDYVWVLKGLLYTTNSTDLTLAQLSQLVGKTVRVDANTVDQTYTKKEIDPQTALETEVEKTITKTFVNKYLKA
jgi:hypothetical protein